MKANVMETSELIEIINDLRKDLRDKEEENKTLRQDLAIAQDLLEQCLVLLQSLHLKD